MFEFQYFLTAVLTMIGFVNAMPPRAILGRLKAVRSRRAGPEARPAAAGSRRSGGEGRQA